MDKKLPEPKKPTKELPTTTELSTLRIVGELTLITGFFGSWLGGTTVSLVGDLTPFVGDGTFFGQIAGFFAACLVWRVNALRRMLWKRFVG